MLASKRHTSMTHIDAVDEAGKRRSKSDDECYNSTPVCRKLGRVAIDAIELVHIRYRDVATTSNVVAMIWLITCDILSKRSSTHSVMMMAVMGPRKIVYPLRKARNFWAEARIFHCDVLLVGRAGGIEIFCNIPEHKARHQLWQPRSDHGEC